MSLWRTLRSAFPVTAAGVHLDHARLAPISSRVEERLRDYVDAASRSGGDAALARVRAEIARVRERVGLLLGAGADEVAFVPGARHGLALALRDVAWRRGDVVVRAGALPESGARHLAERGVDTIRVPLDDGAFSLERIEDALRHPRARMLVLAAVEGASGARAPLPALGDLCADRGVLLCVDASHCAGALDLHLRRDRIDYAVADGHRFLLATPGSGVLLRSARLDTKPSRASGAAERFEADLPAALGVVALGAAVDLLLELGMSGVEKRILELTDRLAEGLAARDLAPRVRRAAARSGIVAFAVPGEAPERTVARLAERRIWVSAADGAVRASPHAHTRPEDVDALLELL